VHLYAIAAGISRLSEGVLGEALERVGVDFALDRGTRWEARSPAGAISAAGVHHPLERCAPRRYVSRSAGAVTWFDGLPVSGDGSFLACDAGALGLHWRSLAGALEGQFNAAHLDLENETVEVLLDSLATVPVYYAREGGGVLVSNSIAVITSLLGLRAPDPLGVSSFLGLGWAASDRVLTSGVRLLCGGARHAIGHDGSIRTDRAFGPESIPSHADAPVSASALAERLTELTRNAVHPIERVGCAITAGRDSRVLMALLQAAGEDALYFTGGGPHDPDVVIASEITTRLGLRHEVVSHDPLSATFDWTDAAARFMRQNDGLSSLLQLPDYIELGSTDEPLGVKLGGVGGEIGRAGTGQLTAIATNVPILSRSVAAQRKLLAMKSRNDGGLMTPAATEELARYLDEFRVARLDEGWRPAELQEAFYTFERVGRWGATGTRRVSATDDGFSPLCLRPFIEYCFSLKSSERYIEAVPYRLLAALSPTLLAHRFETPLPRQQPWLAPILATGELARAIYTRAASRWPTRRSTERSEAVEASPTPSYPFQHAWFEDRLQLMRELFSTPSSDLWSYISRPKLEALLDGSETERTQHQEQLLRATTVFWHFHGNELATERDQQHTRLAPR